MYNGENIEKYVREDLRSFCAYSASTSPETLKGKISFGIDEIIKIDANENPYGCSPKVQEALYNCKKYNIYPDAGQEYLREALAGYVGAGREQIVAANGSNQLIDLVTRLFIDKGDEVINCTPTFDIYRFSAALAGGKIINVKRNASFDVDVSLVKNAVSDKTKLIFIANPNNPTGNLTPRKDIISILDLGIPTLLDEAYYEFCGETVVDLMGKYPNLMIIRTFSKWAGLAGIRVGFGVFPEVIAKYLQNIKIPYNVSAAGEVAVYASLSDLESLQITIDKIKEEKQRLYSLLRQISWVEPIPSSANFVLCKIEGRDAETLKEGLKQEGILVRHFSAPELKDYIRFSAGKPEDTDMLIRMLKKIGGG